MLYNFHDSPADLFERMRLNVALNEELGIRIFSFPMRYQPTDLPDRTHVGERWNRYFLRSMQIILQATHGVVSGSPTFFKRAFGDTYSEFDDILIRPQHFIFNREWYERLGGRSEFDEYSARLRRLSASQRQELSRLLSSVDPRHFSTIQKACADRDIRAILQHYMPIAKERERAIWAKVKEVRAVQDKVEELPPDEHVEDAGLFEDDYEPRISKNTARTREALPA
jgi:hypothetical protein